MEWLFIFFPMEIYFAYNVLVSGVEHGGEIRARKELAHIRFSPGLSQASAAGCLIRNGGKRCPGLILIAPWYIRLHWYPLVPEWYPKALLCPKEKKVKCLELQR